MKNELDKIIDEYLNSDGNKEKATEIISNRITYNNKCLEFLQKTISNFPQLRIEQIIDILDRENDYFHEEPDVTLERWNKCKFFKI